VPRLVMLWTLNSVLERKGSLNKKEDFLRTMPRLAVIIKRGIDRQRQRLARRPHALPHRYCRKSRGKDITIFLNFFEILF